MFAVQQKMFESRLACLEEETQNPFFPLNSFVVEHQD
jgi:hypothetical protein